MFLEESSFSSESKSLESMTSRDVSSDLDGDI